MEGVWPGELVLDEIHLCEMRAIVWAQIEDGATMKGVAAETGLTLYKLREFLTGVALRGKDLEDVARWCEDKPRPRVSADLVALGILASYSPNMHARGVRTDIANAVLRAYAIRNVRLPPSVIEALTVL
jgi:hypothetical protein